MGFYFLLSKYFLRKVFATFLLIKGKAKTQFMTIQHREDANRGSFYISENGKELAEMVYAKEKDRIIIEHTEVDESLQGKNVGFQMVVLGVVM